MTKVQRAPARARFLASWRVGFMWPCAGNEMIRKWCFFIILTNVGVNNHGTIEFLWKIGLIKVSQVELHDYNIQ